MNPGPQGPGFFAKACVGHSCRTGASGCASQQTIRPKCRNGSFSTGTRAAACPAMSAVPPKAEVNRGIGICHDGPWRVDDAARRVIQAPKLEPRIMRYELTDYEWRAIKPFLPNKPRASGTRLAPSAARRHALAEFSGGAPTRCTPRRSAGTRHTVPRETPPVRDDNVKPTMAFRGTRKVLGRHRWRVARPDR